MKTCLQVVIADGKKSGTLVDHNAEARDKSRTGMLKSIACFVTSNSVSGNPNVTLNVSVNGSTYTSYPIYTNVNYWSDSVAPFVQNCAGDSVGASRDICITSGSAICRRCCRSSLPRHLHRQRHRALFRGSAQKNPAHGLLRQRDQRRPHHLPHLPEIQPGLEKPYPQPFLHKPLDITMNFYNLERSLVEE